MTELERAIEALTVCHQALERIWRRLHDAEPCVHDLADDVEAAKLRAELVLSLHRLGPRRAERGLARVVELFKRRR